MFANTIRKRDGFTIIELIVVVAIIGLLVLIAAPRFTGFTKDAKIATMQADVKVLENAAMIYELENDELPTYGISSHELVIVNAGEHYGLYSIDEESDALTELIKNTKNDISKYRIITSGNRKGEVLYVGVERSKVVEGLKGRSSRTKEHYGSRYVSEDPTEGELEVSINQAPM